MNILHHKSWHVRNKNNIAKVRADEKKAREEEEAKEKRKLIAESEARVNLLRNKARSGNATRDDDATISSIAAILDGKEPSSVGEDRQNVDHEKEAKKDKEDWEKKVGILTYLGQGCNEDNPWYLLDHNTRMNIKEDEPSTSGSLDKQKSFLRNDPLIEIERYLATMKKNKAKETSTIPQPKIISSTPMVIPTVKQEIEIPQRRIKKDKKSKRSKYKKHKSRHKKLAKKSRSSTRSESDSSSSDESSSSNDDDEQIEKRTKLEALRAERLRREKAERERAHQLLNKSIKPEPKVELDDRKRSYNSQFNPHLARQNLEKPN